nr:uncharacterized protein CFP56_22898 [Quercus suber]
MESIPFLEYAYVTFWVQFHNIPLKNLTYETGELIGRTIGTVMAVADPENDGSGGEFLRVRLTMDITKPLPRCSKLRSEGKQLGLVGIKYERLPNFCYWCGRVTHGERDCEVWLCGKGKLRREDQQYGEWLRADPIRPSCKTVAVITGAARSRAPWWRKNTQRDPPSRQAGMEGEGSMGNEQHSDGDSGTGQENSASNIEVMKNNTSVEDHMVHLDNNVETTSQQGDIRGVGPHVHCLEEVGEGLINKKHLGLENNSGRVEGIPTIPAAKVPSVFPKPRSDCMIVNSQSISPRKWKRLARQVGTPTSVSDPMHIDRRPTLEVNEESGD